MLIGIKLQIGFSERPLYRLLYGDNDIPGYLRALGFNAVETPVDFETEQQALCEHVVRCQDADLRVSLHPYCEKTASDPAFFSEEPDNSCRIHQERLLSLAADVAEIQQSPTVVNMHPAAGPSTVDRRELVDRSVSYLTWARQWCSRNAPDVEVVVELQFSPDAGEPVQRMGDTYDELLEIATRSDVRASWDFGHAYFNTQRFDVPLYPSDAMLERIGHVHCHDVCVGDHCPLIYDTLPWREFIRLLIDKGYDDTIILEVPPSAFLAAGGLESVDRSVDVLMDWIEQCEQKIH